MGLKKKIATKDSTRKSPAKSDDTYFVIMAGGRGERFWPLSTERVPKPFIGLIGKKTFIELTVERARRIVPIEHIFIVLGKEHVPVARTCLPGLPQGNFIVEPIGRDTAPCIALAASIVKSKDPRCGHGYPALGPFRARRKKVHGLDQKGNKNGAQPQ